MPRTLGIEEEFLIVDADGSALRPAGGTVAREANARFDGQFEHELKREQAELGTAPHRSLETLATELRRRRAELAEAAAGHGARLVAAGVSLMPAAASVTRERRYEQMHRVFGDTARTALTCGMHVHVGVDSRADGVRAVDAIRAWLPALLALSANSPFADGRDTGHASQRSMIWQRWPTAGPTAEFADETGYDAVRDALVASGAALDDGMLYFDARVSAHYPTVEIRAADVCLRVEDAVTIAALARALVDAALAGSTPPVPHPWERVELLRAATWRAARYGLTDSLVSPVLGALAPAAEVVGSLLETTAASLAASGDDAWVSDGARAIVRRGTGSALQRRVLAERGHLAAVVDALADLTLAGCDET